MNRRDWPRYIELLHKEVVPALGCTEPIAVALAAARASEELGRAPDKLEVLLSGNVLKNGMGVGIPGTGLIGLEIAAACGAMGGDSKRELEVLEGLTDESLTAARSLVDSGAVSVSQKKIPEILYIEVIASEGEDRVRVIIRERHTFITLVSRNGKVLYENSPSVLEGNEAESEPAVSMTERDVWDFAMKAPLEDLDFIMEAARLNTRISEEGLKGEYGLKVGSSIDRNIARGFLEPDLRNEAVRRTASGADARMAGSDLPVMSNSGSGNQGITATMPVVAVAEKLKKSEEELIRALILSHLTAIHIKSTMFRLSALCGASVAATGASCGIVYLLGGGYEHVEYAIRNMVGDVAGMVCDGAKNSCSLKIASCVSAAVQGALLAIDRIGVTGIEGIVDNDIEKTIANLGHLGSEGMMQTDQMILDIMTHKTCR